MEKGGGIKLRMKNGKKKETTVRNKHAENEKKVLNVKNQLMSM